MDLGSKLKIISFPYRILLFSYSSNCVLYQLYRVLFPRNWVLHVCILRVRPRGDFPFRRANRGRVNELFIYITFICTCFLRTLCTTLIYYDEVVCLPSQSLNRSPIPLPLPEPTRTRIENKRLSLYSSFSNKLAPTLFYMCTNISTQNTLPV